MGLATFWAIYSQNHLFNLRFKSSFENHHFFTKSSGRPVFIRKYAKGGKKMKIRQTNFCRIGISGI
jgi:hypothetical protein